MEYLNRKKSNDNIKEKNVRQAYLVHLRAPVRHQTTCFSTSAIYPIYFTYTPRTSPFLLYPQFPAIPEYTQAPTLTKHEEMTTSMRQLWIIKCIHQHHHHHLHTGNKDDNYLSLSHYSYFPQHSPQLHSCPDLAPSVFTSKRHRWSPMTPQGTDKHKHFSHLTRCEVMVLPHVLSGCPSVVLH